MPLLPLQPAPASLLQKLAQPIELVSSRTVPGWAAELLSTATHEIWFPNSPHPEAALCALWLRAGGWDQAHDIAQDLPSPEGSLWHAIVHRLEPDGWNAGYWYKQARSHPVLDAVGVSAAELCARFPGTPFHPKDPWDPEPFIDFCLGPAASPGTRSHALAVALQDAEWRLLFEWCARGPAA